MSVIAIAVHAQLFDAVEEVVGLNRALKQAVLGVNVEVGKSHDELNVIAHRDLRTFLQA